MTTIKTSKSAIILLILLIVSSFDVSSQNNVSNTEKIVAVPLTIEEKLKALEGTIQFQVNSNTRQKPSIPYNIDEIVEKNRKQDEVVYVSLGKAVRLMILPNSQIKNKSDNKLPLMSKF